MARYAPAVSQRRRPDLAQLLVAVEDSSPASAVSAAAAHLRQQLGAIDVAFLIADAAGQSLLELETGKSTPMVSGPAGAAWRMQRLQIDAATAWVPVTVRGDALGVLRVGFEEAHALEDGGPAGVHEMLRGIGHALGYILLANQRHTDRYEIARRSQPFNLAMEIQRRLLPSAFVCEGGAFTLAGWLEPTWSAGGDTFDYIASTDRLTVTLTDAVGHDVAASLLATLTVSAIRNARRDGADLVQQALAAHEALLRHAGAEHYATGLLLEADLRHVPDPTEPGTDGARPGSAVCTRIINAGHPPPRLVRGGTVSRVEVPPDTLFGVDPSSGYHVHEVELLPGDRLVLLTDGMLERAAAGMDLDSLLRDTADEKPRNAVQHIFAELRAHVGGRPDDDATLMVLDWHGGGPGRTTDGGADVSR
jgi:serine phosphatase RsbU (regulator of sigma subunit)